MSQSTPASPPIRRRPLLPLLGSVLFLSLFALITIGVWQKSLFVESEEAFKETLHAHALANPGTAAVFAALTDLAGERSLGVEGGALLLLLAVARKWRWAGVWMLAFFGNGIVRWLKVMIDRPRPIFLDPIPNMLEKSPAFPSGHAAGATIMAAMLAYFVAKTWPKLRLGSVVLAGWFILMIGFSRIYLGVHWFSDVLGGITVGLGWIFLCIAAAEALEKS